MTRIFLSSQTLNVLNVDSMDIIKVIVLGRGSMKKPKKQREMQNTLMMMHDALAVMKIEIDPMWILCDNESTVDIFRNKNMITNIRKSENHIRLKE